MNDWEKFEIKATDYLNNNFKDLNINFKRTGKKNSLNPDIKVFDINKENILNIEAKLSPSQSGQFVVLKENNKFIFSNNNICDQNQYVDEIINHLNKNFSDYKNGGNLPDNLENLYENRIILHYLEKNSHFFITSTQLDTFYSIIPTKKIGHYFKITATLRKKRSGTSHLPIKDYKIVKKYLIKHFEELDIKMNKFHFLNNENKAVVILDENIKNNSNLYFGDQQYYLSKIKTSNVIKYYVKKRSNVNNFNVIFSLKYIGPEINYGTKKLKQYIINKI